MDFSKFKNRLLILLCCFVVIFPFWCIKGLCAEDVSFSTVNGIFIDPSRNYFQTTSTSGLGTGYFEIENGYIYTIKNTSSFNRNIAMSNSIPAVNVTYQFITTLEPNESYSFISTGVSYLYFDFSGTSGISIEREEVEGMNNAVNGLVNNVGINNLWNIFDTSINYIVIVILFAFGFFIIVALIKKLRKGKGGI